MRSGPRRHGTARWRKGARHAAPGLRRGPPQAEARPHDPDGLARPRLVTRLPLELAHRPLDRAGVARLQEAEPHQEQFDPGRHRGGPVIFAVALHATPLATPPKPAIPGSYAAAAPAFPAAAPEPPRGWPVAPSVGGLPPLRDLRAGEALGRPMAPNRHATLLAGVALPAPDPGERARVAAVVDALAAAIEREAAEVGGPHRVTVGAAPREEGRGGAPAARGASRPH
jgi:hypothetical protein